MPEGRLLALKKMLCNTNGSFADSVVESEPIKKATFNGETIFLPSSYLVFSYYGKDIIIHQSEYYSYRRDELMHTWKGVKERYGIEETPYEDAL